MNALDTSSLRLHVPLFGWLFVVANACLLITGVFALILLEGIGLAVQNPFAYRILILVGGLALVLFVLLGHLGLIAGAACLRRRHWPLTLALVIGILQLATFPIGTAPAISAFLVLLQTRATERFDMP